MDVDMAYWGSRPDTDAYWGDYLDERSIQRSMALADIMKGHCQNLPQIATCHEIGAGLGRNLAYIHKAFPDWQLSANDINPHAKDRMAAAFPELVPVVPFAIQSTQDWIDEMIVREETVDVIVSVAHLLHIERVGALCKKLADVVGRYLVLYESGGTLNNREARRGWADANLVMRGDARWFDRDYYRIFSLWLHPVMRKRWQMTKEPNARAYDFYVFEKRGERCE